MASPSVSILIPSFNHGDYVGEAVRSALGQSLPPLEVIVVDDGSGDRTPEVLASFGDRIRWFPRDHQGIAASFNFGVQQARGEWIAFLESDDALEPGYLEAAFRFLAAHPGVEWVSTARRIVDSEGRPTGDVQRKPSRGPLYTTESILRYDLGCASTPVVRRDALLDTGPFDSRTYGADTDMALRFSLRHGMGYLDKPLYRYRRHGANTSWSEMRNGREVLSIVERFRDEHRDYAAAHPWLIRRCLGKYHGLLGVLLMDTSPSARRDEVLPHLLVSVRLDPLRLKNWRRLLLAGLLGPRLAGAWRRLRRRRRDRRRGRPLSAPGISAETTTRDR